MIPKTIHYCWFGGKPIPNQFQEWMKTWPIVNPDFEIKRWDETNAPENWFMEKVLKKREWAKAADFTRLYVVHRDGGIYLDVDIECIKSFVPLLSESLFLAFSKDRVKFRPRWINNAVIGSEKKHPFLQEAMEYILTNLNGNEHATESGPALFSKLLLKKGLNHFNKRFSISGIKVFPKNFVEPVEPIEITTDTYVIHHFSGSWRGRRQKLLNLS